MSLLPPVSCPVSFVVCVVCVGCCDIVAVAPHPLLVLVLLLLPKVAIYTWYDWLRKVYLVCCTRLGQPIIRVVFPSHSIPSRPNKPRAFTSHTIQAQTTP